MGGASTFAVGRRGAGGLPWDAENGSRGTNPRRRAPGPTQSQRPPRPTRRRNQLTVFQGRLRMRTAPRLRRAGHSSEAIWRRNRRRAFKAAWRFHLLSVAVLVVCTAGIRFYAGLGELIWAGIIGALAITHAFVWTIGRHPSQLRFLRGVWGERQTARELSNLGTESHVLHDVPRKWGNWDHIAVSRAGVLKDHTRAGVVLLALAAALVALASPGIAAADDEPVPSI